MENQILGGHTELIARALCVNVHWDIWVQVYSLVEVALKVERAVKAAFGKLAPIGRGIGFKYQDVKYHAGTGKIYSSGKMWQQ